jgi:TolB-like protein/tetratricopeptide (TPR) repeat protein
MQSQQWVFSLSLMGPFRLSAPDGVRVEIPSTKGMALIAMLAVTKDGERSRGWLQDRLWGSRQRAQAQSSLRRELSILRKCLNKGPVPALVCEHHWVKLDLAQFRVDIQAFGRGESFPAPGVSISGEFLEGFDIPGEDGFEEWLREQRRVFHPTSLTTVGTAAIQQTALPQTELFTGQSPSAPRFVDRPALAVLPFANMTGDIANDYLCEGLSEDLIDRLSRLRWLPVIARNSTFTIPAGSADPQTVGQRLGARYVLEGRLRPVVGGYTIALNLSDATNNTTFWSHRLPIPLERSQDALDPIVANLVGVLDVQIDQAEQLRARGNRRNGFAFNDLIWRGRWHLNKVTHADSAIARELFHQALEMEPDSPEALIQETFRFGWSLWARRATGDDLLEFHRLANRAMLADPDDGRAVMLAGKAELWLRHHDRARALAERAISLNPSLCHAHADLGCLFNMIGEPAGAIAPLRMAQRLSPNDNYVFFILGELALAYWMLGRWEESIVEANQSLMRRPAYWYAAVIKLNAQLGIGDEKGARNTLDELLTVRPNFASRFIEWTPFVDSGWNQRLKAGVDKVMKNEAAAPQRRRSAAGSGSRTRAED